MDHVFYLRRLWPLCPILHMLRAAFCAAALVCRASALPFAHVAPVLTEWYEFAHSADAARPFVRDPSTAVYDPATASWHVYATALEQSGGGYPGQIRHFSLNGSSLAAGPAGGGRVWSDEGIVLGPQVGAEGAFDASGVFTPAVVRDCAGGDGPCTWYLFYGGVRDQSSAHAEMVGVASAPSPWGPFVRHEGNPVFSYRDANSKWCNGAAARVDEIKAVLDADGTKLLAVKSVCSNFTALPVMYAPQDQRGWGPPYQAAATVESPLFPASVTCQNAGFEEPTFFTAPDGYLHFTAHNHGHCSAAVKYEHFISRNHSLARGAWVKAASFGGDFMEPVPVPRAGDGVFGQAIFDAFIDFDARPSQSLTLFNVTWKWVQPGH
eukprot:TRINITY_DN1729_c0_g1_i1.p1 TRINITY_DN1729_c0_g1~~TRINITY_DN1729_c0_g1_i1.p1  ORF type:complete len:379 (+),score=82.07 TRINITY_DN1729_c0_g1_i1:931-2067(+)